MSDDYQLSSTTSWVDRQLLASQRRAAVLKKIGEEYHRQNHIQIDTPYHYEPTFERCEDPLCVEVRDAIGGADPT